MLIVYVHVGTDASSCWQTVPRQHLCNTPQSLWAPYLTHDNAEFPALKLGEDIKHCTVRHPQTIQQALRRLQSSLQNDRDGLP